MGNKLPFILGAGVGYVLGTRAGRAQYEKMKKAAKGFASSKPVQDVMHKADETVGDYARRQATNVTDSVAGLVKDKINTAGRSKPKPVYPEDVVTTTES